MLDRLKAALQSINVLRNKRAPSAEPDTGNTATGTVARPRVNRRKLYAALIAAGVVGGGSYVIRHYPPLRNVPAGDMVVRINQLTGGVREARDGSIVALPGLHELRVYSLRDQTYRPEKMSRADGSAPLQSIEGLSFGVDLTVRYALDADKVGAHWKSLDGDTGNDVVDPAVQGIVYKTFARYTVREIFSSKRPEIQKAIEAELAARLAADGVVLRAVYIGRVDLPADYRRGMDALLAEELAAEKMRYTLELKDKQIQQTALEGEADKVRREKAAEAAGREQVIAARAQEEAMKHVLPFKQRQIEQRQLEAEADKQSRIRIAEGSAQARRVESAGEADAREKLADAEAYRLDRVGKVNATQMEREGILVTRHPLLIQKVLADKLSDKIQVIIASPPADGGFIGANLLGTRRSEPPLAAATVAAAPADATPPAAAGAGANTGTEGQ